MQQGGVAMGLQSMARARDIALGHRHVAAAARQQCVDGRAAPQALVDVVVHDA